MMKKFAKLLLVGLIAGFLALPGYAADVKIGFIDGNEIIKKYQPAIDEKLKKEFKDRESNIVAMQEDLKKLDEKLRRDNAILSASELKNLQLDFQTKEREFQRQGSAFNEDITMRGNQELQSLVQQVQAVVKDVAKANNYEIVLQRGTAVYFDDKYDITATVLKQLDTKVKL